MTVSRRGLISAGALVVAFAMHPRSLARAATPPPVPSFPNSLEESPFLDSWIRIDATGAITVFTGKVEIGQGIKTALIQVAAEELDVPPSAIRLITADTAQTPNEGVTAGSHSMQDSGEAIRTAAASVRLHLAGAAAARFRVRPDMVRTSGSGQMAVGRQAVSYGELAATLSLHVPATPNAPRRKGPRRTVGKSLPRVDLPAKLAGGAAFLHDLRLPGMLHARVVRPPSEGAEFTSLDTSEIGAWPGVKAVVRNGRFLSIVSADEWTLMRALETLQKAPWRDAAPPIPSDPLTLLKSSESEELVILDKPHTGSREPGLRARYTRPWLMHGSIGPSCAIAQFKDGTLTVWSHSQGVYLLRRSIAALVKLPVENVRCIHVEGAGCYGHNGADDVAADAALTAMAVPGPPIRLQWTRAQEHGWEPLGPGMVIEAEVHLDRAGRIADWRYDIWSPAHSARPLTVGALLAAREVEPPFPPQAPIRIPLPDGGGERNGIPIYDLPSARIVSHFVKATPQRGSSLRALGAHLNVFAIESLMDELARQAGVDPVTFRLSHLSDSRGRAVVTTCAEQFGWSRRRPGRNGHGSGFAFARYKNGGAYCAVALQLEVSGDAGQAHVRRVVGAIDAGEVVNPDGVRNQIEGAIVQSLSWTRLEAVTFDGARRSGLDWSGYPIARFPDVPEQIDVHLIDRPSEPFLGVGEAGQGPAAAAFANAIADATGVRLRDMPLSAERLTAALKP